MKHRINYQGYVEIEKGCHACEGLGFTKYESLCLTCQGTGYVWTYLLVEGEMIHEDDHDFDDIMRELGFHK